MEMEKALVSATEYEVHISVPFTKFDKANRKVSGFATIDNIDQSGDVLTAEASLLAFETFRGNMREQHDRNKAVGKVVSFEQKDFYDQATDKMYSGIYVTAYVSRGAQDTWEKVLDGTLSGFSVKGAIVKQRSQYVPDEDKTIRFIEQYTLEELSLVDSPCNQLCNVFSIEKSADGVSSIRLSDELNVDTENVFWCDSDSIAVLSKDDSMACSKCEAPMKNAGWIESIAGEDKIEKMKEVLATAGFTKSDNNLRETKGGSDMADEVKTEETVETPEEGVVTSEDVQGVEETVETTEEAPAEVSEPDLQNIAKALEEIKSSLSKVTETGEARETALADIRETVAGVEKAVDNKLSELHKAHTELADDFKTFKATVDGVEKRLSSVESASAIQKSADIEDGGSTIEKSNKQETKSFWSRAFLPTDSYDQ